MYLSVSYRSSRPWRRVQHSLHLASNLLHRVKCLSSRPFICVPKTTTTNAPHATLGESTQPAMNQTKLRLRGLWKPIESKSFPFLNKVACSSSLISRSLLQAARTWVLTTLNGGSVCIGLMLLKCPLGQAEQNGNAPRPCGRKPQCDHFPVTIRCHHGCKSDLT